MRYVSTDRPARFPQLLQVLFQQRPYSMLLLHAEDEHYGGERKSVASPVEHAHDVFHIVLYTSGDNRFWLKGQQRCLQRGTLVVTAPGEPHSFFPTDFGCVTSNELTFSYTHDNIPLQLPTHALLTLISGVDLAPVAFPLQLDERQTRRIEALFDLLFKRLAVRDAFCRYAEQQMMSELFTLLILDVYGTAISARTAEEDPVQKVRTEIDRRYSDHLTIPELAQQVFLSGGHLIRAFKARFGIPPLAYQQTVRIRAAKTLLLTSSRSISDIATMVGYQEIASFSKMFKRTVGVSPQEYRNTHR